MKTDLLGENKVIAILRNIPPDLVKPVGESLISGGIKFAEITMNSEKPLEGIKVLKELGLKVGAGTVLDSETAKACINQGVEYLITPCFKEEVISVGKDFNITVITGAFSPTEILDAYEQGSDYIKVFPVGSLGPNFIRDLISPFPHIPLIPTGGVSLETVPEYLKAGAKAVGIGSSLINSKLIEEGNFLEIEKLSKKLNYYITGDIV